MPTSFGSQPEDVVSDKKGNVQPGVTLELYASRDDATSQSSRVALVVTNEDGLWPYSDSLNRTLLFARDPKGHIWAVDSEGAAGAAPIAGLPGLPTGSTFTIYWNGTDWTYGGNVISARPSDRTDLTMLAIGGSAGPGFGVVGVDLWLRESA